MSGLNTAATLWCAAAVGVLSGGGFYEASVIATTTVLAANVLLRPLARRIDRRPAEEATELECAYRFRVVCRESDEAHVRALLLQTISKGPLTFQGLRSEDLEGGKEKVEVVADLVTMGRNDTILEDIVARLSLEPGVSGVSWYCLEQEADEARS